jgi:dipeptidyl aminopeptidase/acylaminoacyl peptidase
VSIFRSAVAAAFIFSTLFSFSAKAAPTPLAFAQAPLLSIAKISPSGRYFFARVTHGENSVFTVFDLSAGGAVVASLLETENGSVRWATWANDDTILMRLGFLGGQRVTLRVEGESENYYTASVSEVFVMPVPSQPGEEAKSIWNLTRRGAIVNILYNEPDYVLVEERSRSASYPSVYKKSIRNDGEKELIQRGISKVYSWEADRNGVVRIGYGGDLAFSGKARYKLLMRAHGETEFRDLSEKYYTSDLDQKFIPLEFAEDIDQVYVASNHETDTLALYLFDIREENFVKQLYHNPDFDVDSVSVDERTGALISISYGESGGETIWFNDEINQEIENISVNFPGRDVTLASFSTDADAGIVAVNSTTFGGQLYIYDRGRGELSPLPPQYPGLPENQMGKVIATSYPARDGETIPAYVTLPPGIDSLDQAKNLPFIIYPHGGPAARDFHSFDIRAQFFATRGYGVLQMNFRGSAGYGLKFEKAGRRQWGQLMQDDVTDGVNWLTEDGVADPKRVAIFGGSYGGYTALMGAVLTPRLYRCAVSFAGVTSLPDLVSGAQKDSYVSRLIGDRFKQGDELREYSPLFRADDFAIPVLLIHGRLDGVVPYDHAKNLYAKLKKAGKTVEFVTLPRSAHGLNDYQDRVRFYELLDNYFSTCLPK